MAWLTWQKWPQAWDSEEKTEKFNMGAMQSHLNQNVKTAQTKERLQQKLEQRRAAMVAEAQKAAQAAQSPLVFSTGEKVERTPRIPTAASSDATATDSPVSEPSKKKKKNKK